MKDNLSEKVQILTIPEPNMDEINKMLKDLAKVLAILEYYPKHNKPYPVDEEQIKQKMMELCEGIIEKMSDVNPFEYCFDIPALDYWLCNFYNCLKTTDEFTHRTVRENLLWALEDVNRLRQRDKIKLLVLEDFDGKEQVFIVKNREYFAQMF